MSPEALKARVLAIHNASPHKSFGDIQRELHPEHPTLTRSQVAGIISRNLNRHRP